MIIEHNGHTVEFKLPQYYKKIGVNCSGGADSAILLYAVCKYIKDENLDVTVNVITCSNDLKDRWNGRKAADVINFIVEELDFKNFDIHYVYYRDAQAVEYFHEVEGKLFQDGRIQAMVSGITQKPMTGDTTIENIEGKIVQLRDVVLPDRETPNMPIWDGNYWNPMANIDKKFVAHMFDYFGVRDTLLPLTRSCEAKPLGRFDPDFEQTPCGKCWWCLERKWAFGEY